MPGITTKELMARIGHASPRAALIYQHATAERDQAIASFLDDQLAAIERPALAAVVGLDAVARGVGAGLGPAEPLPLAHPGSDLRLRVEVAAGIEPAYRALQALA